MPATITIKALSLKQPWANMIAEGEKTIETRRWCTSHRGSLLICSSRQPRIHPAGYAVAVCTLADCRVMVDADEDAACCQIYPGAFAWVLTKVWPIVPFPVRGQLRLFDVTAPVEFLAEAMDGKART